MPESWSLPQAFDLRPTGELVAIVGGGGKTGLMFALARALPGRVITTTTTRIFAAQTRLAPAVCLFQPGDEPDPELSRAKFANLAGVIRPGDYGLLSECLDRHGRCLVIGRLAGDKASGVPVEIPGHFLARPDVDFVLVEADGSRMRPCKAPAEHEPVIPPESTVVVPVAGIDALGGRLVDVAHRPERVAELTGLHPDDPLTIPALATLLSHSQGGLKAVPDGARVIALLNKVESAAQLASARQVARLLLAHERIDRVVIGAVSREQPVQEVRRRVTAVVLAAGASARMGQTKQLLPWGETTVLGRILLNLQASSASDLLVVTGYEAEAVAAEAAVFDVPVCYNPDFATGEMISSLQVAVRGLHPDRAAVLVMLADQPQVEPAIIDQLLDAYAESGAALVAPQFNGQRGNPVIIDRSLFPELLALPVGEAPRALLRRHAERLQLVEVGSPAILQDIDNPDQYRRWRPTG